MKVQEFRKMGVFLKKYLTYNYVNLWELSEVPMYQNFFKTKKRENKYTILKDYIYRYLIRAVNYKKEKEKYRKLKAKKEILLIVYGSSSVNTFIPILEKIGSRIKVIRYDPPSEMTTKKILKKKGILFNNLDSYVDKDVRKNLIKFESWLKKQWNKIIIDDELKEELGENYSATIKALEYFCETRKVYLEIMRFLEIYKKMYEKERPKLILVADDNNAYGKAAVIMAKKMGIKSICVQHGQIKGSSLIDVSSDKILVGGFKDRDFLVSCGVNPNKIIVTGNPRYDKISRIMKKSKKSICKKLGLDPNKKIIVFAAQEQSTWESSSRTSLKYFLSEINKMSDKENEFVIIIRKDLHKKSIPLLNKKTKAKIIRLNAGDLDAILYSCDILLTAFSTVALDAILMNRPVVTINFNEKIFIDYGKEGVGITIYKKEKLLDVINKALNNKNFNKMRKKFIKNYNYKMDGNSAQRIIKIIKKEL